MVQANGSSGVWIAGSDQQVKRIYMSGAHNTAHWIQIKDRERRSDETKDRSARCKTGKCECENESTKNERTKQTVEVGPGLVVGSVKHKA